jgi:N-acetylneuraminic acid mutarotase
VWDGSNAYIFGGYDNVSSYLNQVARYDPSTDTLTTMTAAFPTERGWTSAVWDGSNAYIFGGYNNTASYLNQILRYNPATDTATLMTADLPTGRFGTSAVWDGSNAYIFGGFYWDGSQHFLDEIVRYSPSTNTVTTMSATLPTPREDTSAVWDGSNAYIFGGWDGQNVLDQVVRYDPATDTVTLMDATFPTPNHLMGAVWDGSNVFLFGGANSNLFSGAQDGIVRFNPATDTAITMSAKLPTPRFAPSAVWTGSHAYVFGGGSPDGSYLDQVVRYALTPGAPQNLTISPGPDIGQLALNWQLPPSNTYSSPPTGYKVYRGSTSGGETFLAYTGAVTTYTDTGLGDGATRWYRVSAITDQGEGPQSSSASATTFAVPTAPRSLAANSGPGIGEITLTWQAPSSDGGTPVTGYSVDRSTTTGGPSTRVATLGAALTYRDSGLTVGTRYYYRVAASNLVGEGPKSSEANAPAATLPSAPRSLTATAGPGGGEISLGWQAPSGNGSAPITGYRVYRATSSGGAYNLAGTVGNVLSFTDGGLGNGVTRSYVVRAVNAIGEGPQGSEATATTFRTPGPPTNLHGEASLAFSLQGTSPGLGVKLMWQAPGDTGGTSLTGYKVDWSTNPNDANPSQVCAVGGTTLTCTHSHADPLKPNYYWVLAENVAGQGPNSARACALTYPWPLLPGRSPPGGGCLP